MERDKNPLFKKYLNEGNLPTTYLTPERRKDIYDFMRLKVNCAPAANSAFCKCQLDQFCRREGVETFPSSQRSQLQVNL